MVTPLEHTIDGRRNPTPASEKGQAAPAPPPERDDRGALVIALRDAMVGLSVLYVAAYIAIACLRMAYPFELEWLEGSMVDEVRRALSGQVLYVAPSLDYMPWLYGPAYFYVSALVARVVGIGLLPLRLVSFTASLGCFVMLFLMVKRETASNVAAALAVGIFAACYRAAGAWYDLGRVDMLALFLLLAAVYLLQLNASLPVQLAAAALVTFSFLTKQVAIPMMLPLMLWSLRCQGRRGLAFVGATLVTAGISIQLLSRWSGGWSDYYLFRLLGAHPVVVDLIGRFWTNDLISVLPIALAAAVYFLIVQFVRGQGKRSALFWLAAAIGFITVAWASRVHAGGFVNVVMPAYAIIAALAAMGAHATWTWAKSKPMPAMRRIEIAVYILCIIQFGRLAYDPATLVPTEKDRQAGELLVAIMEQLPGEIYMSDHGYLPTLAGKQTHARPMAIEDLVLGRDKELAAKLESELEQAVREQRFAAIIADSPSWLPADIETYYSLRRLPFAPDALWPVTGVRTRPQLLYLPRRPAPVRGESA